MPAEHLPLWRSHKLVRAAKITDMHVLGPRDFILTVQLQGELGVQHVDEAWLHKRLPDGGSPLGGYFVAYEDGYTSWSPAEPFERGHTREGRVNLDAAVTLMLLGAAGMLFAAGKMLGGSWQFWYGTAGVALTTVGFIRMWRARRDGR